MSVELRAFLPGYESVGSQLRYNDAPYEGVLRRLTDGTLYAFRCDTIILDKLWHWILLPTDSAETPIETVFAATKSRVRVPHWISVLEDHRDGVEKIYETAMRDAEVP